MADKHVDAEEVDFTFKTEQQYAFHLRLTPQLLEALIGAGQGREDVSIHFGSTPPENAIAVGGSVFGFNAVAESGTCDLLQIAEEGGEASVVARVKQKLLVQRNFQHEKQRVRARAAEAERERKERKTVVLRGKPGQVKGGHKTEARVRSVTPPLRGLTPPPRPHNTKPALTQSMLATAPQQQRPPLPPAALSAAAAAAGVGASGPGHAAAFPGTNPMQEGGLGRSGAGGTSGAAPALGGGAAGGGAPRHGAASHKKGGSGGGGGAGSVRASSGVLAAASRGGLRPALMALLVERPLTLQGVRSALADVASRLRGFKVPADKAVIERALKSVAEFRAPGKYFLHEWLHKEAEAAMVQGGQASGGKGLRDPSPPSSEEVGISERAAAGTRRRQSAQGKRSRESTPEGASPAIKGQQQKSRRAAAGAAAGGEGGRPSGSLSSAPAELRPGGATGGEGGQTRGGVSGGGATFRTAPAAATPPCPSPQSMERTASGATVATATTTTSNSSERAAASGKRARADGGDGTGGRVGVKRSGATAGRSSSSRGSQEFDDSWIEQHAGRQPEEAAPISSKQEYHEREAAFGRKYEVYFRLHQLIEANKKDFAALRDALRQACTPGEKQRHQAEIDKLLAKRGERAKRWDAAFRVLHSELSAAKRRMGEFVEAFQAQQAQPHQGQQQKLAQIVPVQ